MDPAVVVVPTRTVLPFVAAGKMSFFRILNVRLITLAVFLSSDGSMSSQMTRSGLLAPTFRPRAPFEISLALIMKPFFCFNDQAVSAPASVALTRVLLAGVHRSGK